MIQDNTQEAFFSLLRVGLWSDPEKQVSFDGPIDWEEVYQLATEQSVLGLVLAGIDCLPNDQRPPKVQLLQWIGEIQLLEQQNKEMNLFIGEMVESMRKEVIYTLLVKGQGIAQCYERPLWRSCGDVDFFLSEDNYVKAKEYLIPLSSSVEQEGELSKHLGLTIDPWIVELHGTLRSSLSGRVNRTLDEVQDDVFCGGNVRSWMNGNTQVFLLGVDCDVVYVFAHFLSHFYKGGVGLRQICDWCRLLWTYKDKIKLTTLEKRLQRMGLMTEWKAFGVFAVDYLGMPAEAMPFYSSDRKWKRKAALIASFIIKVGNFGHNRDSSFYKKYPYLLRKAFSFGRVCLDLVHHARIFPVDSFRFFPSIVLNGVKAAARGE